MAEDNLTVDEFNTFADEIINTPAAGSSWNLDSLFSNVNKLTDSAGKVIGAVGAGKAAIANAKLAGQLRNQQLTQGTQPQFNTGTLQKLLPWILGFGALIVAAIVILPLLKSSSK